MEKERLKTGAMLNPECQKCSKKDTCNEKTLCAYLISKEGIENAINDKTSANSLNEIASKLSSDIILKPAMVLNQMIKDTLNKQLFIGVNFEKLNSKNGELKDE